MNMLDKNFLRYELQLRYRISLNNVRGHLVNKQFQKCKNLSNIPFLCTTFSKQGTLFKGGHYLRKQGTANKMLDVTALYTF